jgi:hypothetical protein
MCSGTLVAAQSRAILPVFGGISGSTREIRSIAGCAAEINQFEDATSGMQALSARGGDEFVIQKERRVSLEVLVVPFERPCWPQKFVCASGGLLLKRPEPNYLFLAAFLAPFFAAFLVPPFFAAFFPPFLVAILSYSFFSRF